MRGFARVGRRKGAVVDVVAAGVGVTKNGNPLSSGERLRFGDVIAIDSSATWVVDATPRGSLGVFARAQRSVGARDHARDAGAVRSARLAARRMGCNFERARAASDVTLTVDRAAIDAVQRGLDRRCADAASGGVRQCSAMLVDAETGDILAVRGLGEGGCTSEPVCRARSQLPKSPVGVHREAVHRGGGAQRVSGAPIARRRPPRRAIRERRRLATRLDDSDEVGAARMSNACRSTWDCFIPNSNNLYAVTLGFLGAAQRGTGRHAGVRRRRRRAVVLDRWSSHGAAAAVRGAERPSSRLRARRSRSSSRRCSTRVSADSPARSTRASGDRWRNESCCGRIRSGSSCRPTCRRCRSTRRSSRICVISLAS